MTRAAIYARMSTDKQSVDSPADQVAACRRFAASKGLQIVDPLVFEEAGISGASRHNRPRLLELIARIDEWDVLLCFDFSRLARNSEDLGWVRNRLRLHRRTAYEAASGLDVFNVGSKVLGIIAEEYLEKLRADTHRGLRGRVERGFRAGGTPYGYRTVAVPSGRTDAHGRPEPAGFRMEPDPETAPVVARIFDLYAGGDGYRTIAHQLNVEGIPSPRGGGWAVSALQPMLRNPIYRGEYVWNRSEWVKDHETGRRRRFERPEADWIRQQDEGWRIVPDATWQAVQERRQGRAGRRRASADGGRARGKTLLSGLLECGACGGGFWVVTPRRELGCGARKDRGAAVCGSDLKVPVGDLEARILGALREEVLTPENVAYVVARALALVEDALEAEGEARDRARLAEVEEQIERAVDLGIRSGGLDAVTRRLDALRAEQRALEGRLAASDGPPAPVALRTHVEALVGDLRAVFEGAPEEMRRALRTLLGERRMRVLPDPQRGYRVEGLFELPLNGRLPGTPKGPGQSREVAGGGFEPPTFGL